MIYLNEGDRIGTKTGDDGTGGVVGILLSKTCGKGKYPSLGFLRFLVHNLFLNIRKKSRISSDEVV